jgi:hypothetical protein
MTGDSRAPSFIWVTVVFGLAAVAVVTTRILFRYSRRVIDAADISMGIALVRIITPILKLKRAKEEKRRSSMLTASDAMICI